MNDTKIKILIADDHPIFCEGIKSILDKEKKCEIIASCRNGLEAYDKILDLKPDVAILDIDMPRMSGLKIAEKLNEEKNKCLIVILTIYKDEEYFNEAMDLGVKGFLVKDSIANELIECIEIIMKGDHYISPVISEYLITRKTKEKNLLKEKPEIEKLTSTEKKILQFLAQNKTSKQIADVMFISEKTVQNHRNNISQKLNLKGPHKLLEFSIKNKHLL